VISIALGKFIMIATLSLFGHSIGQIQENPIYILLSLIVIGFAYYLSTHIRRESGIDSINKN